MALIAHLNSFGVEQWTCHFDLHETTDTDEIEFRPAKAARDGETSEPDTIPDGFYFVADITNKDTTMEWYKAMIEAVKLVTHIAPPEKDGKLMGIDLIQEGVIGKYIKIRGLCAGVTNAPFATTTEVYPDSPTATPEQCNQAQVACVTSGLTYIRMSAAV